MLVVSLNSYTHFLLVVMETSCPAPLPPPLTSLLALLLSRGPSYFYGSLIGRRRTASEERLFALWRLSKQHKEIRRDRNNFLQGFCNALLQLLYRKDNISGPAIFLTVACIIVNKPSACLSCYSPRLKHSFLFGFQHSIFHLSLQNHTIMTDC